MFPDRETSTGFRLQGLKDFPDRAEERFAPEVSPARPHDHVPGMHGQSERPQNDDGSSTNTSPAFELATSLFAQRVPPSLRVRASSALSLLTGAAPSADLEVSWQLDDDRLTLVVDRPDPDWFGSRATVVALVDSLSVEDLRVTATFDRHPVHFEEEDPLVRILEADVLDKQDLETLVRAARAGVDLSASPFAPTIGRLLTASLAPVPSES